MNAFIVMGRTGERSDKREWMVAAYFDAADAKRHAEAATACAQELYTWTCPECGTDFRYHWLVGELDDETCTRPTNEYDPRMGVDYTGTAYSVATIDVRLSFDDDHHAKVVIAQRVLVCIDDALGVPRPTKVQP